MKIFRCFFFPPQMSSMRCSPRPGSRKCRTLWTDGYRWTEANSSPCTGCGSRASTAKLQLSHQRQRAEAQERPWPSTPQRPGASAGFWGCMGLENPHCDLDKGDAIGYLNAVKALTPINSSDSFSFCADELSNPRKGLVTPDEVFLFCLMLFLMSRRFERNCMIFKITSWHFCTCKSNKNLKSTSFINSGNEVIS